MIGDADGKVSVVAATNDEARARGLSANDLVRAVGPLVGGKGGGKDDVAQGGGTDASRIDEALALVRAEVAKVVEARHPARPRPRRRPDRGGAQRPVRVPGDPGGDREARPRRPGAAHARSSSEIAEDSGGEGVIEIVVGLPRSLSGGEGPAAAKVRAWAAELAEAVAPAAGAARRRASDHRDRGGYAARP